MLSEELNDAGYDMKKVLKPTIDIPWTPTSIKEHLWKPTMKAMLNKESTTEMTTGDIDTVYEVINRAMAKYGIHVPFPSIEQVGLFEELAEKKQKKLF